MSCLKNARQRVVDEYGPCWRVPLGVKQMDMPYWAYQHKQDSTVVELRNKLKSLRSENSGLIEESAVREVDKSVQISEEEMPYILAQLNVLLELIS